MPGSNFFMDPPKKSDFPSGLPIVEPERNARPSFKRPILPNADEILANAVMERDARRAPPSAVLEKMEMAPPSPITLGPDSLAEIALIEADMSLSKASRAAKIRWVRRRAAAP